MICIQRKAGRWDTTASQRGLWRHATTISLIVQVFGRWRLFLCILCCGAVQDTWFGVIFSTTKDWHQDVITTVVRSGLKPPSQSKAGICGCWDGSRGRLVLYECLHNWHLSTCSLQVALCLAEFCVGLTVKLAWFYEHKINCAVSQHVLHVFCCALI